MNKLTNTDLNAVLAGTGGTFGVQQALSNEAQQEAARQQAASAAGAANSLANARFAADIERYLIDTPNQNRLAGLGGLGNVYTSRPGETGMYYDNQLQNQAITGGQINQNLAIRAQNNPNISTWDRVAQMAGAAGGVMGGLGGLGVGSSKPAGNNYSPGFNYSPGLNYTPGNPGMGSATQTGYYSPTPYIQPQGNVTSNYSFPEYGSSGNSSWGQYGSGGFSGWDDNWNWGAGSSWDNGLGGFDYRGYMNGLPTVGAGNYSEYGGYNDEW
jgi:hypothetical protein